MRTVGEFPLSVKEEALKIAGHRCECRRTICGHSGRCCVAIWSTHEAKFRHIFPSGKDELSNCEVLCHDCYIEARF